MFKFLERARDKFSYPIYLRPGDTLQVTFKEPGKPDRIVFDTPTERTMVIDEIAVFDLVDGAGEVGFENGATVVVCGAGINRNKE
jgi:hypothetical protein